MTKVPSNDDISAIFEQNNDVVVQIAEKTNSLKSHYETLIATNDKETSEIQKANTTNNELKNELEKLKEKELVATQENERCTQEYEEEMNLLNAEIDKLTELVDAKFTSYSLFETEMTKKMEKLGEALKSILSSQ